jgi:hypothetical protein
MVGEPLVLRVVLTLPLSSSEAAVWGKKASRA